ncbi:MAG: ketoacyl-ACP synthase III [Cyclobacteriaceae bacterium]|nr:ketoacyl-ACP synthase III [Cyclobacteriaceae bacterium]
MQENIYSIITGSGRYIPTQRITNSDFLDNTFFEPDGKRITRANEVIIQKFSEITGILERRYVTDDLVASDIGYLAADDALTSSHTDAETLDYIIVAHNFGDVAADNRRSDLVPALASRIKMKLGIKNPDTVCYDLPFGCAGWLQGVIQADFYIKSGMAKKILVIGAETLSRICDPHDRDSMIYADGAGAVILEATRSATPVGILAHQSQTNAGDYTYVLKMESSCNPDYEGNTLFLKMRGRALYEHALKAVPAVIKASLEKANIPITDIKKVFIHQANTKMDEAILNRLFEAYGLTAPDNIMPMSISWLGNSSVATVPTLYDLVSKGDMPEHQLTKGSVIIFAAVGAGVNINSVVYRIPD